MDWKLTFKQAVEAAKSAADAAAATGKTAIELHKLNQDIKDAKLALAELYLERYIGGADTDEETAALCDDILENTAKAEAMAYAAQDSRSAAKDAAAGAVQSLKDNLAGLRAEWEKCTECSEDECCCDEDEDIECCPACGRLMLDGYQFCPGCGAKLESVDDLVDSAEVIEFAAEATEAEATEAETTGE